MSTDVTAAPSPAGDSPPGGDVDLPSSAAPEPLPPIVAEEPPVDPEEFKAAFGEDLAQALDLATWVPGDEMDALYGRLEQEVEAAVAQETVSRAQVRAVVFPRLRTRPDALPGAGVFQATVADLERVHRGLLFKGLVEACDGTSAVIETLPIGIAQIGVCLTSYQGDRGSWVHRMFRRDLRMGGIDPVNETLKILERRRDSSTYEGGSRRDTMSELARRGIMAFAERAVLVRKATAPWRMGHGSPAPYELLTGSGMRDLLEGSIDLLEELVMHHQKFLFVPSTANRFYLTIGDALHPLEYAIVESNEDVITRILERGHYRGAWADMKPRVRRFAQEAGSKIAIGVFRASAMAPAQVFYAHANHVHEAALIALADSALQEHRGFPMLIDLANTVCSTTFGGTAIAELTKLAYVEARAPYRYMTERQSRK